MAIKKDSKFHKGLAKFVEDHNGMLVPKLFKKLGGEKNMEKQKLASNVIWHWISELENEKPTYGGNRCPYLQPSTVNTYIRTLLGYMKEEYDWRYSLEHDFNFTGGLGP